MSDAIVILGAGQAGLKVAETLRRNKSERPIVLVGDEAVPPYQRPPLSKSYLMGAYETEKLWLQSEDFFAQAGIDLKLGQPVRQILPDENAIAFADGSRLAYGTLVLSTGSGVRALPVPGTDLVGVHKIRTLADTDRLRTDLETAQRVAIVGGGYIGLEAAASMRALGKNVALIELEDRLLKRVACEQIATFFTELHAAQGVELMLGARVRAIAGDTRVEGVELADGRAVAADLVLVAIGGSANDQLAAEAGLACNDGVVVDAASMTSQEGIYAVGDCARFYSKLYGRMVRLESVQNAIDQARAAADAICGETVVYDPVPWFWSDQYDKKLQIVGLFDEYDETEVEGDVATGRFAVSYRKAGDLVAVSAVNFAKAYMLGRRALEQVAKAE